jgi:hypothetical protein
MVRFTYILFVLTASIALRSLSAVAQTPLAAPAQLAANSAGSTEPDPLPGLPRPPDQPGSLLQPPPAGQVYACPQFECPYFETDPRLDPCDLPHPGWLFDVEVGIIGSHVMERLGQTDPPGLITVAVPVAGHGSDVVIVPMARLDWAVSPRFELGYRLPSGFGEVDFSYRFLSAQGNGVLPVGSTASPDGDAALNSRLDINLGDVDYAANETSLESMGLGVVMKWRIGLRIADSLFNSTADEQFADAQAGSGIYERRISDNFWGIGPHAALELHGHRNQSGLGWVARLDGALLFGSVTQRFSEISTTPGPGGLLSGATQVRNDEQVPMLGGFVGLDWRPACRPNLDLLLGYSAEYWWNVGRLSDMGGVDPYNGHTAGELGFNGVQFRVEYNY